MVQAAINNLSGEAGLHCNSLDDRNRHSVVTLLTGPVVANWSNRYKLFSTYVSGATVATRKIPLGCYTGVK